MRELNRPIQLLKTEIEGHLRIDDLRRAILNAESKIRQTTTHTETLKIGASTGYGTISGDMSNREAFRAGASLFAPSKERTEALILIALLEKLESLLEIHRASTEFVSNLRDRLNTRIEESVQSMYIDEKAQLELLGPETASEVIKEISKRFPLKIGYGNENHFARNRLVIGSATSFLNQESKSL